MSRSLTPKRLVSAVVVEDVVEVAEEVVEEEDSAAEEAAEVASVAEEVEEVASVAEEEVVEDSAEEEAAASKGLVSESIAIVRTCKSSLAARALWLGVVVGVRILMYIRSVSRRNPLPPPTERTPCPRRVADGTATHVLEIPTVLIYYHTKSYHTCVALEFP